MCAGFFPCAVSDSSFPYLMHERTQITASHSYYHSYPEISTTACVLKV